MPTMRKNKVHCNQYRHEAEVAVEILSGKWVVLIIAYLGENGILRFGEFRRRYDQLSPKVLTEQLHKLEKYKIITKTVYPEVPPKVEYRLTEEGKGLIPIIRAMQNWAASYIPVFRQEEGSSSNDST